MVNVKVGDEVFNTERLGTVVGFNSRGFPIVEWKSGDILVEDPENITLILEEN
jgi:hypothetical protein